MQRAIFNVPHFLSSSLFRFAQAIGMDKVGLAKTLVSASLVVLLVRVLQIEMPALEGPRVDSKADPLLDWPLSYKFAVGLLGQLSAAIARDDATMAEILKHDPVEALMQQLDRELILFVVW